MGFVARDRGTAYIFQGVSFRYSGIGCVDMVLKLIPGFLLGQWCAFILWMAFQTLTGQGSNQGIAVFAITLAVFLAVSAGAATLRAAWGRCFAMMAAVFLVLPPLNGVARRKAASATDGSPLFGGDLGAGFPREMLDAVGQIMFSGVGIFFGLLFLVPALALLRRPGRQTGGGTA